MPIKLTVSFLVEDQGLAVDILRLLHEMTIGKEKRSDYGLFVALDGTPLLSFSTEPHNAH